MWPITSTYIPGSPNYVSYHTTNIVYTHCYIQYQINPQIDAMSWAWFRARGQFMTLNSNLMSHSGITDIWFGMLNKRDTCHVFAFLSYPSLLYPFEPRAQQHMFYCMSFFYNSLINQNRYHEKKHERTVINQALTMYIYLLTNGERFKPNTINLNSLYD